MKMLIAKAKVARKWKLAKIRKLIKKNNTDSESIYEKVMWLKEKHKLILDSHAGFVFAVAISHDNKYVVSVAQDCKIRVWNIKNKLQVAVLEGHKNLVYTVAISFDSKYIVSGSKDQSIRI